MDTGIVKSKNECIMAIMSAWCVSLAAELDELETTRLQHESTIKDLRAQLAKLKDKIHWLGEVQKSLHNESRRVQREKYPGTGTGEGQCYGNCYSGTPFVSQPQHFQTSPFFTSPRNWFILFSYKIEPLMRRPSFKKAAIWNILKGGFHCIPVHLLNVV